jgi:hypothetical protein
MDHKIIGCERADWMDLAQGTDWWWAVLKAVMNHGATESERFLDWLNDY